MTFKSILTATAMVALLAGCEQITQITEQPPAVSTEPQFFENAYAARKDGSFNIPAIPEDQIPVAYRRQIIPYATDQAPGTIIIDPNRAVLYLVQEGGKAIRYGISVGRDGFGWSGTALVSRKGRWPTWTPPAEMIARQPSLEKWRDGQPGGPTNPMGARALYLTLDGRDYGYRIHGTPEWRTIGRRASSGCFRMIQQDIIDLHSRVPSGTKVIVLNSAGEIPTRNTLPPPAPKPPAPKRAAAPVAETATPAVVEQETLPAAPEAEAPEPAETTDTPVNPPATSEEPATTDDPAPDLPAEPVTPPAEPADTDTPSEGPAPQPQ
ncbi:L,D-transpeptidase [Falsirhodobacter halotolerans]|uniref:L,D-transpeptidase n=1 Tax=Falsirhodobacter halotolerans TaxID=1146892 RepID=UPI001FCF917F|nr:L,D-transpeptidase [Falsirhodobacter halotolerans]MCJ8139446.1 L,D-transpeptidase [Falsirhodobacter halotolerans]